MKVERKVRIKLHLVRVSLALFFINGSYLCAAQDSSEEKSLQALQDALDALQKNSADQAAPGAEKTKEAGGLGRSEAATIIHEAAVPPVGEQGKAYSAMPSQNSLSLPVPKTAVDPEDRFEEPLPAYPASEYAKGHDEAANQDTAVQNENVGIDTMNLSDPQGNWLRKSILYERSQITYEKMRAQVDQIWDLCVTFFNQRSELDRSVLDPFYISVGLRQGELQEIVSDVVARFEAERAKDGDLNLQEREVLGDVKAEQLLLERLDAQVKMVSDLDHAIDDALNKLMEQLSKVRAYEKDAWNNFKKISQVLSDTKARELYYAMDIQMRNIKDAHKYLQNEFKSYFNGTISRVTKEIKGIKADIEKLKEHGIDLKKQADLLVDTVMNKEKSEKQIEGGRVVEGDDGSGDHQTDDNRSHSQKKGFLGTVFGLFKNVGLIVSTPFRKIYGLIFG